MGGNPGILHDSVGMTYPLFRHTYGEVDGQLRIPPKKGRMMYLYITFLKNALNQKICFDLKDPRALN